VENIPSPEALHALANGVTIGSYQTRPAEVELLEVPPEVPERTPAIRIRRHIPTAWIRLTLREGKNRQVRRMTAAVGHPTLRLIRESILNLTLVGLSVGEWRSLSDIEIKKLKQMLQL
jgi:pseudouridine synthase